MRQLTMLTAAAALTAVPAVAGAQSLAGSQCAPTQAAGQPSFELLITVEGASGTFRLTCRDGRLVAIPAEGQGGTSEAATEQPAQEETTSAEVAGAAKRAIDKSAGAAAAEIKQGADLSETPNVASDEQPSQPAEEEAAASASDEPSGISAETSGVEQAIEDSAKAAASMMKDGADLSETPAILPDRDAAQSDAEETAASSGPQGGEPAAEDEAGTDQASGPEAGSGTAAMDPQQASPSDNAMIGTPALEASGADGSEDEPTSSKNKSAGSLADTAEQAEASGGETAAMPMSDQGSDQATPEPSTAQAPDMGPGSEMPGGDTKGDLATLGISPEATGSEAAEAAEAESDMDQSVDPSTAMNAAGVTGQEPTASVTQTERDDSAAGHTAMAKDMPSPAEMNKPGVSADEAAPDGSSLDGDEQKSKDRIASRETDQPDMVPVPLVVIGNAELALPGVSFKSVSVAGEEKDRVYSLRGITRRGTEVSVDVDPTGHIRQVDREIAPGDVPDPIARIADAVLPNADIEHVTLSSRDNYRSFFIFSGSDERGSPVVLEIRSDGRRVEFKKGI
ncbi:hypothetical protein [Aurantimonas sp. VKM B-3413]|uniref:hypothetical protein n=1 Tax=Aurantimonas sp. VKM B-3413 TaxID=2779401 RepID=UPI001E3F3AA8|nr:hypothetical protein [Aurantimonas sp. VKM B-3413]MCB8838209.1 hypothetical protein [Aurantimonas sp. VKM B-3413]